VSDSSDTLISRLKLGNLPNLCALGPRLLTMSGLFNVWLRNHFATPDNIKEEKLRKKIWTNDYKTTSLVIETHTAYKTEFTESRPAIIHKRHAWTNIKVGIDSRFMPGDLAGSNHYANYWQGSHTFFAIAGAPGEAELMAIELYQEFNEMGPAVRLYTNLMKFAVAQVGEIGKLEEAGQKFVVPITVGYVIEEAWRLKQEAPFFKRLDVALMF